MRTERVRPWSEGLVGADRDAAAWAGRVRQGASLVVAGPRGSGRSYALRAIAAELQRAGTPVVVVRTAAALSSVPFGALDASGDPAVASLREAAPPARIEAVVVLDDVDALDIASARAIARAVAGGRLTAVFGLRTARPRAVDRPDDADDVRRAVLDLWQDGLVRRVDLRELSDADAQTMIDLFPDADLLDHPTRAGLVWRADGSRTLLRQLLLEALRAARIGDDPLRAVSTVSRDSRLAVALERHVAGFPRTDLECLAGIRRLAHLELAVATRLFDADSVGALRASGLLHTDASGERRLTANDLFAHEAHRQLGADQVEALVEAAGTRMLAEADLWWSPTVAITVSERWHRLGPEASGETSYSPELRARVALDAARDANDRGDTAHAAAYAARGLKATDDPSLRLEAALARAHEAVGDDAVANADADTRRRIARLEADSADTDAALVKEHAEADARVESLLAESARAMGRLDAGRAAELASQARGIGAASPVERLRAAAAAGTAEAVHGVWRTAREHYSEVERVLDARPRPAGISTRDRLAALMSLLAGHQIAGADGAHVQERLRREFAPAAREGGAAGLTVAGVAAAIAFAGSGRPAESHRELQSALSREPSALGDTDAAMTELGVAEELALSGRPVEAREILADLGYRGPVLVQRSRLYVETTVLAAEGRFDEARVAAREAAAHSRGCTAASLRIRDLFRLVSLGIGQADEIDELVQLAATSDLPLAADAVRRASARSRGDHGLPVDELRLHDLWSAEGVQQFADSPRIARVRPSAAEVSDPPEELTAREREIALLAGEGLTNREVATRLFLSIRTVESHVYQARMKLGAASRRELGRMVVERAL